MAHGRPPVFTVEAAAVAVVIDRPGELARRERNLAAALAASKPTRPALDRFPRHDVAPYSTAVKRQVAAVPSHPSTNGEP